MNKFGELLWSDDLAGGCGFVLPTPYDDNFDCGTVVDNAGTRFAGALGWIDFDFATSRNLVAGELEIAINTNGIGMVRRGDVFACPAGVFEVETDCYYVNPGLWDGGLGLMFYENTTNKWVCPLFGFNFGLYAAARAWNGTHYPPGGTSIAVLSGKLRMGRNASNQLYADYDQGSGWVSLMAGVAQTTDFSVGPTHIGIFGATPVPNMGTNYAYFKYFKRTI